MRLARAGIVRGRWRERVLRRISASGSGLLCREILRGWSSVMARSDRVFGPVVGVAIVHHSIRVRDEIPIPWGDSGRRSNGHGFRAGIHRGGTSRDAGGSLKGLVLVSHGWLGRGRLGDIFGGSRGQPIVVLRGTATHQGILIWLPLRIHIFSLFCPIQHLSTDLVCNVVSEGLTRRRVEEWASSPSEGGTGHLSAAIALEETSERRIIVQSTEYRARSTL